MAEYKIDTRPSERYPGFRVLEGKKFGWFMVWREVFHVTFSPYTTPDKAREACEDFICQARIATGQVVREIQESLKEED